MLGALSMPLAGEMRGLLLIYSRTPIYQKLTPNLAARQPLSMEGITESATCKREKMSRASGSHTEYISVYPLRSIHITQIQLENKAEVS